MVKRGLIIFALFCRDPPQALVHRAEVRRPPRVLRGRAGVPQPRDLAGQERGPPRRRARRVRSRREQGKGFGRWKSGRQIELGLGGGGHQAGGGAQTHGRGERNDIGSIAKALSNDFSFMQLAKNGSGKQGSPTKSLKMQGDSDRDQSTPPSPLLSSSSSSAGGVKAKKSSNRPRFVCRRRGMATIALRAKIKI